MAVQTLTRQVGDTQIAIAAALKRADGTVAATTGLTVFFTMIDAQGNVKVAETSDNVTATDAAAGEVQYDPVAADVDTEGTFYAYFITKDGSSKPDTFPAEKGDFRIKLEAQS
jgi:hypothetical protein